MPDSFAELLTGKPVVAYATPVLEADLYLSGPMSVCFYASSTQMDTAFWTKVVDLDSNGNETIISNGLLKASFRQVIQEKTEPGRPWHPFTKQELLEPGAIFEFQIEMQPVFRTIKAGHRLQVRVASDDLDYNTPLRQVDLQLLPWPVENTIYCGAQYPSHILLPIVDENTMSKPVDNGILDIKWPLRPGRYASEYHEFPLRRVT